MGEKRVQRSRLFAAVGMDGAVGIVQRYVPRRQQPVDPVHYRAPLFRDPRFGQGDGFLAQGVFPNHYGSAQAHAAVELVGDAGRRATQRLGQFLVFNLAQQL